MGARKRSDRKVSEGRLTAGALVKIVVLVVLACVGFFGLWAFIFLLSLPFMNPEMSLILSMLISAITIFALITILPTGREHLVPSKKQRVGLYVAWTIVFAFSLPLAKIDPSLFIGFVPALAVSLVVIRYSLGKRKGKEMAQE